MVIDFGVATRTGFRANITIILFGSGAGPGAGLRIGLRAGARRSALSPWLELHGLELHGLELHGLTLSGHDQSLRVRLG